MRMFHLVSAVLALVAVLLTTPVVGQTSQTERLRALSKLQEIVNNACQKATLSGSRTTFDVKAEAEVAAKGVSRLFTDIRGTLEAGAETTRWVGISQDQFAEAIRSGNDCVARLNEIFVPQVFPRPAATEIQPEKLPFLVRSFGKVMWVQYTHQSVGACMQYLNTYGAFGNIGEECVQAPERLFCLYWSLEGSEPHPECYWTSKDCESSYANSRDAENKRINEGHQAYKDYNLRKFGTTLTPPGMNSSDVPAVPQRARWASCTNLPWADAARQYEAWATSRK